MGNKPSAGSVENTLTKENAVTTMKEQVTEPTEGAEAASAMEEESKKAGDAAVVEEEVKQEVEKKAAGSG